MVLLSNLIEAPGTVVLTVFAEQEYDSASALGLMLGVLGGTALVGALAYSAVGHRFPRRRTYLWCFAVVPVGYVALATLPSLPVALVAIAVMGLAAGPINPLLFTVMTEIVPANLRGRAFGTVRAGAWASIPLGILLGSALVALAGVAATLLAMGTFLALLVAYSFFNPAFREMDRRPSAGSERTDEAAAA
jgi:predicted MFS family arabinose efflux permease